MKVILFLTTLFFASLAAHEESVAEVLTVHEWGTFTAVVNEEGHPFSLQADFAPLPSFVNTIQPKKQGNWTVRIETAVVYFYSKDQSVWQV